MAAARSPMSQPGSGGPGASGNRIARFMLVAWLIVPVALGIQIWLGNRTPPPVRSSAAQPANNPTALLTSPSGIRSQSCSATACHGALSADTRASEIRRDEYFVWQSDPHAQAYRTLLESKSHEMLRRLGVTESDGKPVTGREGDYHRQWANCLACHETNSHLSAPTAPVVSASLASEGVSCESCHGNARDWLHVHYHRADWASQGEAERSKLKNVSGRPIANRVEQCATCHVGGGKGEVTHDLIAAGHPALKFEYVWYQSRLPRHWKTGRRDNGSASSAAAASDVGPTKRWLIGQVVAAIASLNQLERRAKEEGSNLASWPELAEHNCFACHHGLSGKSWRQAVGLPGLKTFAANHEPLPVPWGNWNLDVIEILANEFNSSNSQSAAEAFRNLHERFKGNQVPDRDWILDQTATAKKQLLDWLAELAGQSEREVAQLLAHVARSKADQIVSSWDKTATIVLGFAAGFREADTIPDEVKAAMDLVRFPSDTDSPRDFPFASSLKSSGVAVDDPAELLKRLADVIAQP